MIASKIGSELRSRIAKKKWTQQNVATATGLTQSQVSRICAGNFKRITANVLRVCKYADVPVQRPRGPRLSQELIDAIRELVAGSRIRERAFLKLITAGNEVFTPTRGK